MSIGRPDELKRTKVVAKPSIVPAIPQNPRRRLKLSLVPVFPVMPSRVGQRLSLSDFTPTDEDSLRQLTQIGQLTGLFTVDNKWIEGLEGIEILQIREF
jgi:hypothetical protein